MTDPVQTLLLTIREEVARLDGAILVPRSGEGEARIERFKAIFGRPPPPGYAAFLADYDGGALAAGVRLLSFDESLRRAQEAERNDGPVSGPLKGLWPVLERGPRLFALDAEADPDAEWPVVEVADRSVDRAGTTFLRFLHALCAELAVTEATSPVSLARELCARDPGLAGYWVELADELERVGGLAEMDEVLAEGLRCACPPGPALALAVALRAHDRGDDDRVQAAIEDALTLEPLTARDDDARLDAAAVALALAIEREDVAAQTRARDILGPATASTGAFWRGEAVRALVQGAVRRGALATTIVRTLLPEDTDVEKMRVPADKAAAGAKLVAALVALTQARDALDRGAFDEAVQRARAATAERPDLGLPHALLAEALNARRDRAALEAARKATQLNPALVEAWRELGDALLEARQASDAEAAYREAIKRDPTYGLGHAKLAQALLEQGRTIDALEAISAAQERGGDAFFLSAVRGDILAEMSRHREAAEAYDQALRVEPEDHWVLHQAALEHGRAGNESRAAELFEEALRHDHEGCHQTLVDYGDLLRRVGRIGDAVKMYRKAVAANPGDPEWRQMLREAERELMSAPN